MRLYADVDRFLWITLFFRCILFRGVDKMIVEMMGLLIFFGVALLLLVRYQGAKSGRDVDSKELRFSIESLQKEMDKASTEAIERMGNHVNRFERLMKEAKTGSEDLSHRIKEIRALEDRLRSEMAESRALSEELKRERERSKDLRDELQRQAALTSQIINSNMQVESPMINITSRKAINAYEEAGVLPEVVDAPIIQDEPDNNRDFAAFLTESIEKEEERQRQSFEPEREVYEPSEEVKEMLKNEELKSEEAEEVEEETKSENPSEVAKRLLRAGVSIEETMRQTGMGKGAIELLAQMIGKR